LKFSGVTILQGVEFPIFLLIFEWALQQCSATALPVIVAGWNFLKGKSRLMCWSVAFVFRDVHLCVYLYLPYRSQFNNSLHQTSHTDRHQSAEELIRFSRSSGHRSRSHFDNRGNFGHLIASELMIGWPLTWKTWKSQGIPKWSGKSQGKWNKSGKHLLSWTLDELKSWSCSFWQLVGLDFGYVHHWHSCSFQWVSWLLCSL